MIPYYSFPPLRFGNWLIKASSFDDQILVFLKHELWLETEIKMFYNEEDAHSYIERITNDPSFEINHR